MILSRSAAVGLAEMSTETADQGLMATGSLAACIRDVQVRRQAARREGEAALRRETKSLVPGQRGGPNVRQTHGEPGSRTLAVSGEVQWGGISANTAYQALSSTKPKRNCDVVQPPPVSADTKLAEVRQMLVDAAALCGTGPPHK